MADFDYDLFVIGGGSGGVRAARIASQYGAKVALAEEFRMGGTCVIRGCVPKKLMVYASSFSHLFEAAPAFGWTIGQPQFNWSSLISAKDTEIARLEEIYRKNLRNAGVEIFDARAIIASPHSVELGDGTQVSAKHILVATGGRPFVPDIPGAELAITSNEVFQLDELPNRVVIVGGGYIASEFACILNGMGSNVTQVYRGDELLRGFDGNVRTHVRHEMEKKGITVRLNATVDAIETNGATKRAIIGDEVLDCDLVLYATGRIPNSENLGLESCDIELASNGAIPVDEWSQTTTPSVFAVGDVTDRLALTPVAIREGHAFADTVFGAKPIKADHNLVPTAVFTQPEIGTVGMTEEQARTTHDVEIYRTTFSAMFDGFAGSDEKMLMKLIVDKKSRAVLGAHIVGHSSGEVIQAVGIAVKMGATKEQFDATVAVHPTAAEELVTMRDPVA